MLPVMKLMLDNRLDTPSVCREPISRLQWMPELMLLNGGYMVQPNAFLCLPRDRAPMANMRSAMMKNQAEMLFNRENAMSSLPSDTAPYRVPA